METVGVHTLGHSFQSNQTPCTASTRHGPECFNYGFPQELDGQFLIISDELDGHVPVSK